MLMSVAIRTDGGRTQTDDPQPLCRMLPGAAGLDDFLRPYDVAPDGKRFLVIGRAPDAEMDDAVVVLNRTIAIAPEGSKRRSPESHLPAPCLIIPGPDPLGAEARIKSQLPGEKFSDSRLWSEWTSRFGSSNRLSG